MKVHRFFVNGPLDNFNHILLTEKNNAYIFDPLDADLCIRELNILGGELRGIFITHDHSDHISGLSQLKTAYPGLPVFWPRKNLDGGEVFQLDDVELEVVGTPGHTMDHVCYFLFLGEKLDSVIGGDAIFYAGVGRCEKGKGDVSILFRTVQNVFLKLHDDVKLYPSHDYAINNLNFARVHNMITSEGEELLKSLIENGSRQFISTIGKEKKINPFFRCKSLEEFVKLRRLRDRW